MHLVVRSLFAVAALAVPAVASAAPPGSHRPARTAHVQKDDKGERSEKPAGKPCLRPVTEVASGTDRATFSLTRCDGTPAPMAVDQLSILARPASAPKPKQPLEALSKTKGAEVAPGIRRLDARLLERVAVSVEHFRKGSAAARIELVSGYRPRSAGSYHQSGRALDFKIDGVSNEALVAFCKTLPDTGCGYYPNSLFVHMDVRDAGAGHVTWIDISKPGEAPKYVSQWPLPADTAPATPAAPETGKLAPLPADDSSTEPRLGDKVRRDGHQYFF